MRFWDSSALVPLIVTQPATVSVRELFEADVGHLAWILTDVEVRSGLCRLARENALEAEALMAATHQLQKIWRACHVVSAVEPTKIRAKRLLGVHPLKAADSLQLGAALVVARDDPAAADFVCLDRTLGAAAQREGFRVLPAQ